MSGKWFGMVRWCDDDIAEALRDNGFEDTPHNIGVIRDKCNHHFFKDNMIEAGWDCINAYINESKFVLDL